MPRVARTAPAQIIPEPIRLPNMGPPASNIPLPESPPSTGLVSSSSEGPSDSPALTTPTVAPAAALSTRVAMGEMSASQFKIALQDEAEKRAALEQYIKETLKPGVDYDSIGGGSDKCECGHWLSKHPGNARCNASRRNGQLCTCARYEEKKPKPTLLKPGAEKIANRLHLIPQFDPGDYDKILAMAHAPGGDLVFVCRLVSMETGEMRGMGMGACEATEHERLNSRIKLCAKRAQVDAVLRVAALSDHFTQDLEDGGAPAPASEADSKPAQAGPTPAGAAPPPDAPAQDVRPTQTPRNKALAELFGYASSHGTTDARVREKHRELFGRPLHEANVEEIREHLAKMKAHVEGEPPPEPAPETDPPVASGMSEADVEGRMVDLEGMHPACSKERALGYAELITLLRGQGKEEIVKNCKRAQQHLKIEDKPYEKMTQKERADLEEQLKRWVRSLAVTPF